MFAYEIWEPETADLIYELEKIQNSFLRFLSFKINNPMKFDNHNYIPILRHFNMLSLKQSRIYHNFILLFKSFNNHINAPEIINLFNFYVPNRKVRQCPKIFFIPKNYIFIGDSSIVFKLSLLANNNYNWFELFHPSISYIKRTIKNNI